MNLQNMLSNIGQIQKDKAYATRALEEANSLTESEGGR